MSPSFHRQDTTGDFTKAAGVIGLGVTIYLGVLAVVQVCQYFITANTPGEESLPIPAILIFLLMFGSVAGGYFYWRASRRLRDEVVRCGMLCSAHIVSKDSDIYGIAMGGGNIEYSMTLRIDLQSESKTVKSRVDDLLYHRLNAGDSIRVKLLPDQPDAWVFIERQN